MSQETTSAGQERSALSILFRLFGDVRQGEAWLVLLLAANVFLALVAYYVLKVVREPLILTTGGATGKSYAAAAQALLLAGLVPLYGRFVARADRRRLVQGMVIVFIACTELFYLGYIARVPFLGFVFYVWVGIFSLAIIAQFWSLANDLYATEQGERLFPVIALGAPLGSVAGAFAAGALIEAGLSPGGLLQVAAGLLIAHLALYRVILHRADRAEGRKGEGTEPAALSDGETNGLWLVLRNPYLLRIALLLVLLNLVNTTGEFILSSAVLTEAREVFASAASSAAQPERERFLNEFIGRFYADMFAMVNVATIVLQAFVASRLVRRFGMAGVLFALPLVALSAYGLIAAGVGLALLRIVKVAENSTDYSIMNTARAMLWLPTSRAEKYAGKQAIDTLFVRLGDVLSAGVVFAGTLFFGGQAAMAENPLAPRVFAGFNLVLIAGWLLLTLGLLRRYRALGGDARREPRTD